MSMRVVTSKVRQPWGRGLNWRTAIVEEAGAESACARIAGTAVARLAAAAWMRRFRRDVFMVALSRRKRCLPRLN